MAYLREPDPVARLVMVAMDDIIEEEWENSWMKRLARLIGNELRS